MTLCEGLSLAFDYSETIKNRPVDNNFYHDMLFWYKEHGGMESDYSSFQDVVHLCVRNTNELRLSDAYMGMPQWEN